MMRMNSQIRNLLLIVGGGLGLAALLLFPFATLEGAGTLTAIQFFSTPQYTIFQLLSLSLLGYGVAFVLGIWGLLHPERGLTVSFTGFGMGLFAVSSYAIHLFNTSAKLPPNMVQLEIGFWLGLVAALLLLAQNILGGVFREGFALLRTVRLRRMTVISLIVIFMGLFIFETAVIKAEYYTTATTTILTLEPGAAENVAHITIQTLPFLRVMSALFIFVGIGALLAPQRIRRLANVGLLVVGLLIIPTILVAAAAGDRTNITTMLSESFRLATPIAIGAMAGLWCERSGVINIAIEGMMLNAAAMGFVTLFYLNPVIPDQVGFVMLLAVGVAILTGGITALLHAWLSITFRTDQIVSGTVINIMAVGITSFIRREYLLSTEAGITRLPNVRIPILADIPVLGDAFFNKQPIFYSMFFVILLTHIIIFHTRWGLRTRAVGEHPHAADTLGINVNRTRWINVFIGGLIAGLAGAWFSLEATGRFNDGMTRGAGFIALAALIFGKWTPVGAFGGALLFGFSDALGTRLQSLDVPLPVQFLQMVPFVVTIIVLAGLIGRAFPPKASGQPYVKE